MPSGVSGVFSWKNFKISLACALLIFRLMVELCCDSSAYKAFSKFAFILFCAGHVFNSCSASLISWLGVFFNSLVAMAQSISFASMEFLGSVFCIIIALTISCAFMAARPVFKFANGVA
ncbi:MAG: hypothetical protein QWI73_06215 [Alphaproteobacteria bacterium]|nr:hypothetical protein [Alphaproteobacteria bacterium]